MIPHIDQDRLDEAKGEVRLHGDIERVAGALHLDPEYLGRLLQLPASHHQPVQASDDIDIWAADRLDDVL